MASAAFGLMAFGFALLVVGLVRMLEPKAGAFFSSVTACASCDVTSNVGTEFIGDVE